MKISWKNILLWSLPALVIIFFVWQGFLGSNNAEFGKNIASSRMTYGRFLEYLDMGWVKRVDLYDDGHTAIVEAIGPSYGFLLNVSFVKFSKNNNDLFSVSRNFGNYILITTYLF